MNTTNQIYRQTGIDISNHTSDPVDKYLNLEWDYVITVCGGANEKCPSFAGIVQNKLHIGFDDPSFAIGSDEFVSNEFIRVRDEIRSSFYALYSEKIKPELSGLAE